MTLHPSEAEERTFTGDLLWEQATDAEQFFLTLLTSIGPARMSGLQCLTNPAIFFRMWMNIRYTHRLLFVLRKISKENININQV